MALPFCRRVFAMSQSKTGGTDLPGQGRRAEAELVIPSAFTVA